MDQRAVLRTTLLALQETVRAVASKQDKPSLAIVDQINSVSPRCRRNLCWN